MLQSNPVGVEPEPEIEDIPAPEIEDIPAPRRKPRVLNYDQLKEDYGWQ